MNLLLVGLLLISLSRIICGLHFGPVKAIDLYAAISPILIKSLLLFSKLDNNENIRTNLRSLDLIWSGATGLPFEQELNNQCRGLTFWRIQQLIDGMSGCQFISISSNMIGLPCLANFYDANEFSYGMNFQVLTLLSDAINHLPNVNLIQVSEENTILIVKMLRHVQKIDEGIGHILLRRTILLQSSFASSKNICILATKMQWSLSRYWWLIDANCILHCQFANVVGLFGDIIVNDHNEKGLVESKKGSVDTLTYNHSQLSRLLHLNAVVYYMAFCNPHKLGDKCHRVASFVEYLLKWAKSRMEYICTLQPFNTDDKNYTQAYTYLLIKLVRAIKSMTEYCKISSAEINLAERSCAFLSKMLSHSPLEELDAYDRFYKISKIIGHDAMSLMLWLSLSLYLWEYDDDLLADFILDTKIFEKPQYYNPNFGYLDPPLSIIFQMAKYSIAEWFRFPRTVAILIPKLELRAGSLALSELLGANGLFHEALKGQLLKMIWPKPRNRYRLYRGSNYLPHAFSIVEAPAKDIHSSIVHNLQETVVSLELEHSEWEVSRFYSVSHKGISKNSYEAFSTFDAIISHLYFILKNFCYPVNLIESPSRDRQKSKPIPVFMASVTIHPIVMATIASGIIRLWMLLGSMCRHRRIPFRLHRCLWPALFGNGQTSETFIMENKEAFSLFSMHELNSLIHDKLKLGYMAMLYDLIKCTAVPLDLIMPDVFYDTQIASAYTDYTNLYDWNAGTLYYRPKECEDPFVRTLMITDRVILVAKSIMSSSLWTGAEDDFLRRSKHRRMIGQLFEPEDFQFIFY